MKILRLDLRAFGPFTDTTLDLEAGDHGLHVIYGPNEAGKSAALRALRQFLYGIPERTTDNFRHHYDKFRIGARLRYSDGTILDCIRRKARVNALRELDDKTVVDSEHLARFLAGVDESFFQTMFGIDHKTLVQGGQEIMRSDGQLGQVLFAASAGIADLRNVQESLQSEIAELFRPAGRTQRINKAISDHRDAQAAVKRQQLSADEWACHDRDLHAAEQQKQLIERERQQKSRELHRLSRIRDALPAIAKRKELLVARTEYREAVLVPTDFPEKRQSALETLRVAENQADQAQLALARIDEELQQLDVPEALLEQAERIDDLHRRLGEYDKDLQDRPIRDLQRKSREHEAKEILRSLQRPAELEQAEHLRLRVDEPVRIQNLGTEQQALITRCDNARQVRDDLAGRVAQAKKEIGTLPAVQDPAELRWAIRTAQNEGPVEGQLLTEQHKLCQAEKEMAINLARLSLWSGPPEAVEQLAIPAGETIDRFEADLNQLHSTCEQLGNRLRDIEAELRELDRQIEQLEREQAVPSEEDLQRSRQLRDTGWQLVRGAWLQQNPQGLEMEQFVTQFAPSSDLAQAYERSVERADLVADRLRREATRITSKAKLVTDLGQRRDQHEKLNSQTLETAARFTEIEAQWATLWQPLAIQPLPPREMRPWVRKQAALVQQVQALREQRGRVAGLEERIQTLRCQLGLCLQKLGEPDTGPNETLVAVLERSQRVVDRLDLVKRQGERLDKEIAAHTQELPGAESRARQAETELTRWQEQWAAAMGRLGLEPNASPAQANAVLAAINTLFQKLHEADDFRRRIDGIDRDVALFRADVEQVLQRAAPDLASLDTEAAERELHSRLRRARLAQQDRQNLVNQRAQEAGKHRKAQEMLAETRRRLEAMCREAGCATHEELPRAEQRSARRQQLENDIRQIEEHLLALSAGTTLDEFIADAARVDVDSIDSTILDLTKKISDLESTISSLDQTIGSERTLLEGMHDSAAANEAADAAQNLLAQLQGDVEHYVTLRLAAAVLQVAIERYRTKNQGSVLARASRLFADLTVGSFESLQIDYDDDGQPILIGVRSRDQETVAVSGMSDGSCDQLYLALRLASLEAYLDSHEPMPFIVDDILLNFDNARAMAALKALADLSRRTQVIFFTHHEHLAEMASNCLDADVLSTHMLWAGSTKLPAEEKVQSAEMQQAGRR
jgi:uncharacterized protein YhaN